MNIIHVLDLDLIFCNLNNYRSISQSRYESGPCDQDSDQVPTVQLNLIAVYPRSLDLYYIVS